MATSKLDKRDLKILKILQSNSKITNLELSKRVGLSPAPTLERVRKLEETGIIQGYQANVKLQALGLNVKTFILVTIDWKRPKALDRFLKEIQDIPEVVECYIITGEGDFLLKVVCKDLPSYEQFLFTKLSGMELVERLKTIMTLSTVKETKLLPLDYD